MVYPHTDQSFSSNLYGDTNHQIQLSRGATALLTHLSCLSTLFAVISLFAGATHLACGTLYPGGDIVEDLFD